MRLQRLRLRIYVMMILVATVAALLWGVRSAPSNIVFNVWFIAILTLPTVLPLLLAWLTKARAVSVSIASLGSAIATALYTLVKFNSEWGYGNFAGRAIFAVPFCALTLAVYCCVVGTALVNICRAAANELWFSPTFAFSFGILVFGIWGAAQYGEAILRCGQAK